MKPFSVSVIGVYMQSLNEFYQSYATKCLYAVYHLYIPYIYIYAAVPLSDDLCDYLPVDLLVFRLMEHGSHLEEFGSHLEEMDELHM